MDNFMIVLIALSAGILVFTMILLMFPVSEKERVKARVSKMFKSNSMDDIEEMTRQERYHKAHMENSANRRLISKDFADYITASGIKLKPIEFLYAWIGLTLIPILVGQLLGMNVISIIGISTLGFIIPPILMHRARKQRQELFTKQLSEALIIMENAVKGGFSFRQAMESVAEEMQPPIANEFTKALREMQYGVTQEDALHHMTARLKNQDLDLMVSTVLTSAQVGGSLADILDTIASTIKDRIRIKQEVKTLSAQGRTSALIIGLLPVALILFLMVLNPEYLLSFFVTDFGKIMLIIAILLEVTGFLVIRKITDIEY